MFVDEILYDFNKKFSDLLKYIDICKYDFSKLDGVPERLKNKLVLYKEYTDMSDERIEKIYNGLKYRIEGLIKRQK